jgi:histidine triad (HIT) family protein
MHVIPRWEGDALHKPWDIAPAQESDLVEIQQLITE